MAFFTLLFLVFAAVSFSLGVPVVVEYSETGLVPRLPTALLATAVMLLAFLSLVAGFILDNVTLGRREIKRLAYLSLPPLADSAER